MPSEWITEADREYFRKRYPKTWRHSLAMAERNATEYAERHAPKSAQFMVSQLHLRYAMENDAGDKKLTRRAIDEAIAFGRYCDAHAKS